MAYNGNQNLASTSDVFEFTKEQLKEFTHCARDPIYFIEKYVKIVNIDHGLVNFQMYDFQKDIVSTAVNNRFTICKLPRQVGKALDVETPILTPAGFVRLGDLRVGDTIFGADGKRTSITFITPTMHDHVVYEVVFDNGDVVKADAEHLWTVNSTNWTAGPRDMTTEQLKQFLNHANKPYVKFTEPLDLPDQELGVDPYLLGVWLGDGATRGATITCHKGDLDHYQRLFEISHVWFDSRNNNVAYFTAPCGQHGLKELGVFGNKHIPTSYLLGSFSQRLSLLRGLMDTDGSVNKAGSCEFYQKSESLVDQVRTLLSSLGIKSRKSYRLINGIAYWTVRFNTAHRVFNLARKSSLQKCLQHPKSKRLYVTDIRPVESVPVRCLQVDNNDHLFLCGPTLIPTHNTTTVASLLLWYALFNENFSIAILANKQAQAHEILDRITSAFEYLPKWLQQGVVEWNKGRVELANGSKIIASATSSSAIRGTSQNLIYLDEFAFIPSSLQEQFFNSVYPTISSGQTSKVVITSTPNGLNMFYKLWADSEQNKNEYKRVEAHWSDVPGRDEAWKEQTIKNTSAEQFRQEFECLDGSTEVEILRDGLVQKVTIKDIINKYDC